MGMKKKQTYSFSVILTPAEEGGFTVTVPALPEAITEGDTLEEALSNAKECIQLSVECRIAHGEDVPEEFSPLATSLVTVSPGAVYA